MRQPRLDLGDIAPPLPARVRLSRARGWRKPPDSVVVSRPTRWGNPLLAGGDDPAGGDMPMSRERAAGLYRLALEHPGEMAWLPVLPVTVADVRRELAGRDLACWCPLDGPCHADVLIDIANLTDDEET